MKLLVPRKFLSRGHVVTRFPITSSRNLFVFEDRDKRNMPRDSSVTASRLVEGVVNGGVFGEQEKARIAGTMYDFPYWEVYVDFDVKQLLKDREERKEALRVALKKVNREACVLRFTPAYDMERYYPDCDNMKLATVKDLKRVEVDRILGHRCDGFNNWLPRDPDVLRRAISELIGGKTYWGRPVECIRVGAVYWVRNGCDRVSAMKLLGMKEVPHVRILSYEPARKVREAFPKRGYRRPY